MLHIGCPWAKSGPWRDVGEEGAAVVMRKDEAIGLRTIGPHPFGHNYVIGISARTVVQRGAYGTTCAVENGWAGDREEIMIEPEAVRQ